MSVLKQEELLSLLSSSRLQEYGIKSEPLSEKLSRYLKQSATNQGEQPLGIIAALNNADTNGVLLQILKQKPIIVMEGIGILADALRAENRTLLLPAYGEELLRRDDLQRAAEQYQIELCAGLLDVRKHENSFIVHILTMAELAALVAGCYEPGVYVSVNGGTLTKYPANMTIREVLEKENVDTSQIKALELGYMLTGVESVDLPLGEAGITNGTINTISFAQCLVQEAESRLAASQKQSCGKCVFCREGLGQLRGMQGEIRQGKGKREHLEMIREIGEAMSSMCCCTLGEVSAKTALSALATFGDEFTAHIQKKLCPASRCFSATKTYIAPQACQGCQECVEVCPKGCIDGKKGFIHMIDTEECEQCGRCADICEYDAVITTAGKLPKLPDRLTKIGRFKKR